MVRNSIPEPPFIVFLDLESRLPQATCRRLADAGFLCVRKGDRFSPSTPAADLVIVDSERLSETTSQEATVVATVAAGDYGAMLDSFEHGADTVLQRPLRTSRVLAVAARLIQRTERNPRNDQMPVFLL